MAVAEINAQSPENFGMIQVRVAVPGWIPGGSTSRSVAETMGTIAQAVAINTRTLLVLDELDKATSAPSGGGAATSSGWQQHCLLEIFEILDGRWPAGLKLPDDSNDDEIPRDVLTKKLQETVFIVGIGTFQDYFDSAQSRRTIGFGPETDVADEISGDHLLEKLPRELLNRMCGSLIRLPELQAEHYHRIARQAEDSLPERLRDAFRTEVNHRIQGAINAKKGVRFLEESLMEVLKNLPPEPKYELILTAKAELQTDPFDLCTQ